MSEQKCPIPIVEEDTSKEQQELEHRLNKVKEEFNALIAEVDNLKHNKFYRCEDCSYFVEDAKSNKICKIAHDRCRVVSPDYQRESKIGISCGPTGKWFKRLDLMPNNCPYCKSADVYPEEYDCVEDYEWCVECCECNMKGPLKLYLQDAIEAWNII